MTIKIENTIVGKAYTFAFLKHFGQLDDEDGHMCDICYNNTGAHRPGNVLTYRQFAQGLHWLYDNLSKKGIK